MSTCFGRSVANVAANASMPWPAPSQFSTNANCRKTTIELRDRPVEIVSAVGSRRMSTYPNELSRIGHSGA